MVAVVEGEPALSRCLEAIAAQRDAPELEVIVAWDDAAPGASALAERFPTVRFVSSGASGPPEDAYAALERYDRRRASGLRAARGRYVAMLADRGWPRPDWARNLLDLQRSEPCAALGGAIENGAEGALRNAIFICDFGRFQPPLADERPEFLSDVNVCYEREALEDVRALWESRYQEAAVHWEMRRRGLRLRLCDAPRVVHERGAARVAASLRERLQWGRNFAHVRGRASSAIGCWLRAAASPLLPVVLFARHLRTERAKGNARAFAAAAPALFALLCCWSLGELVGYCEAALGLSRSLPARETGAQT